MSAKNIIPQDDFSGFSMKNNNDDLLKRLSALPVPLHDAVTSLLDDAVSFTEGELKVSELRDAHHLFVSSVFQYRNATRPMKPITGYHMRVLLALTQGYVLIKDKHDYQTSRGNRFGAFVDQEIGDDLLDAAYVCDTGKGVYTLTAAGRAVVEA